MISIGDILLYVGAAAGIGVVIWLILLLTVFNRRVKKITTAARRASSPNMTNG